MKSQTEVEALLEEYRASLAETNAHIQEAIRLEKIKDIELFKSNQIMFGERITALEWVLEV